MADRGPGCVGLGSDPGGGSVLDPVLSPGRGVRHPAVSVSPPGRWPRGNGPESSVVERLLAPGGLSVTSWVRGGLV